MRIIGGEWRGRRLLVPEGIRPMLDRERERLFGVLGGRVEGAAVLDVFAGSGAIALEALSRGARLATLVENGRHVLPVLRGNLEALGAGPRARLLPISAFGLPKSGEPGQGSVEIAVACPPFPLLEDVALRPRFETLFVYIARSLLTPGGILVIEHPGRLDPLGLGLGPPRDTRRTAASALSFWDAPGGA
ncbi:MAG TPA: RsmD family RNA methyltransferase [Planctomycetota bacterium]|nr:RsmD family RNA methyltransferase [Planctomycetota bacterium]